MEPSDNMDQRITKLIEQLNESFRYQKTGRKIEVGHTVPGNRYIDDTWVSDGYEDEVVEDDGVRNAAHTELVRIGKAVNPFLTDILTRKTDYPHYQSQYVICDNAYSVLLETGDYETIKTLIPQLKTELDHLSHVSRSETSSRERHQVSAMIRLMGRFRIAEAVPLLSSFVERYTDTNNNGYYSIEALASIGTEDAITSLGKFREKADYDLERVITHQLRRIYERHPSKDVKMRAGEELGYSPLRIWAHEHPVAAPVTGIVTAGAGSALVYAIVEYFSK